MIVKTILPGIAGAFVLLGPCWGLKASAQYAEERFMLSNPTAGAKRVAVADIDMDGDLDALVGATGINRLVWQPNMGGGNFDTPRLVLDHVPNPEAVELDDVDGDGDPDLICSQDDMTIILLLNGGYGNFGNPVVIATGIFAAYRFQLADIDGDGDKDIVSCASTSMNVILSNGDGTYQSAISSTSPIHCTEFGLGDLTGDGVVDILITSAQTQANRVAFRAGDGTGGFGALVNILTSANPRNLAAVQDVDADGDNDVLVEIGFDLKLFRNNGNGTFAAPMIIPENGWVISIACVDLDADGLMDIILGTWDGVYIKYGAQGIGSTAQVLLSESAFSEALHVADMDQDGRLDIVVAASSSDCGLWLVRQPSAGVFSSGRLSVRTYGPYLGEGIADLDGDGLPDYFTSNGSDGMHWSRNLNYMSFGPWADLLEPGNRSAGTAHDMDSDGDLDILCATTYAPNPARLSWFENDGQMGYVAEHVIATGSLAKPGMALDADGDGDIDVVSAIATGTGFQLLLNDGAGNFSVAQTVSNFYPISTMQRGDLNGDGLPDLVIHYQSASIVVYLNLGGGALASGQTVYMGSVQQGIGIGDLDGDGDVDIVFGENALDRTLWLPNAGDGSFGTALFLHPEAMNTNNYLVFDQNADGLPDVLAIDQLYLGIGNGQFAAGVPYGRPGKHYLADLDADGDLDLVGSSNGPNWLTVRENLGNSPYSAIGSVFHDADGDGEQAPGESGLPFVILQCSPSYASPATSLSGSFSFPLQQGGWTISAQVPDSIWLLSTDSAEYHVQVSDMSPVASGLVFGYTPAVDTTLVVTSFVSAQPRCIGEGLTTQWITVANVGTTRPSALVGYELGPGASFDWSIPQPDSIDGSWLYWHLDSIGFYQYQLIHLVVQLPTAPGTVVSAEVRTWLIDDSGLNEQDPIPWAAPVACSYDPNDKQVSPIGIGVHGRVPLDTDYLYYTVRFQNTGTDTAFTVVIRDALASTLAPATLQVLGTSHALTAMEVSTNGTVSFRFDNILLPDSNVNEPASHGFIRFRIRPQAGLPNGTVVHNSAAIYFDINEPVITNSTTTTLADCALLPPPVVTVIDGILLEAGESSAYQWYLNGEPLPGAEEQSMLAGTNGYYSVQVVGLYDCIGLSEEVYIGTVALDEVPSKLFHVFPNPSAQEAHVHIADHLPPDLTLHLVDVNGSELRVWYARQGSLLVLQWGDLAAGIYQLLLVAEQQVLGTSRIVRM